MSLANHTILLVEDDPTDAVLLRRTFTNFPGARSVELLASGEAAVDYLSGNGVFRDRSVYPVPTLLFLDLKLPGLSGFEVLTWVRQQTFLHKLQVVVLTGSRKTLDVYRAYELGANSYLVKPVKPEDIVGLAQSLRIPWLHLAETAPAPTQAPSHA
jgi:CheY-like chemotaxis protein